MKKKVLGILLVFTMLAGLLTGCGKEPANTGGSGTSASGEEKASGDRTLHINWLSARNADEAVIKAIKDVAASYKEENPDLDFSFETENISDRSSYLQKLKILAASDELPEWYDSDPDTWFADLVKAGKAYSIEDLYNELGVSDKIFTISKEYARLSSGELNLMTFQCNTEYFFYNKKMFQDAGITSAPGTYEEFLKDCQILKDKGYTPLSMGGDWPILRYFAMVPFRLTGNDYIMNSTAGKASFTEAAGIEGAEFMQNLSPYFQTGWSSADYDTMVDLFASGQTAMLYNGTWVLADLSDENGNLKEDFGYFTMPVYSDDDATASTDYFANSGIGTAVRSDSMDEEMKSFIHYLIDHYAKASLSYNNLPSVMPDDETMSKLSDSYQQIIKDVSGVKTYAKCWDVVINSASVEPLEKETTSLVLGHTTPQEWAKNMDEIVASENK
ncbi:ABC transporter substrate-binding protein [Anaerobium acetethylicum]|uniref:Raffinose/stachyose/melibiose transport system substrate-binding protein n=1 Tax=Anaerobium acetethylicum TaxID=1619234 RepID=A0A1D3TZ71_9FIRM|nr:extracellular solute-binding protein [Anaerobium acetethylicum]SCP99824.1 raffinose/stachyose/melibiose transport system substrate-binding protein [Anaerobium acetethylicum]